MKYTVIIPLLAILFSCSDAAIWQTHAIGGACNYFQSIELKLYEGPFTTGSPGYTNSFACNPQTGALSIGRCAGTNVPEAGCPIVSTDQQGTCVERAWHSQTQAQQIFTCNTGPSIPASVLKSEHGFMTAKFHGQNCNRLNLVSVSLTLDSPDCIFVYGNAYSYSCSASASNITLTYKESGCSRTSLSYTTAGCKNNADGSSTLTACDRLSALQTAAGFAIFTESSITSTKNIVLTLAGGSSEWWLGLVVSSDEGKTAKVEVKSFNTDAYKPLVKESWGAWTLSPSAALSLPLTVRLTSSSGQVVEHGWIGDFSTTPIQTDVSYPTSSTYPTIRPTPSPTPSSTPSPTPSSTPSPTPSSTPSSTVSPPSLCPVSVSTFMQSSWQSPPYTYYLNMLEFTNPGTTDAVGVKFTITLPAGAIITESWRFTVGTGGQYVLTDTVRANATQSSAGFILRHPSNSVSVAVSC